jgi:hyperosmotically inducible protein
MRASFLLVCSFAAAAVGCNTSDSRAPAPVATDRQSPAADAPAPDNTAVNRRDAEANTKTPLDQKENQTDINLAAEIRQRVLDVKDLSINARNAKFIAADGKVTLRGPVNSDSERATLEKIARDVAGEKNVENQLEVAATDRVVR